MKLYYAPGRCSLAAHIALRETERRFDLERVDLGTLRTSRGQDFGRINPKRQVPVLELDEHGDAVLTELPAILLYLADLAPDRRLAPASGTFARYFLEEWLAYIATELHARFTALWAGVSEDHAARLRGEIGGALGYLQGVIANRAYLMGETFTVADAYLFVMLLWCGKAGIDLQLYPNIDYYELQIAQRPAVQAALATEGLEGRNWLRRSA